MMRPLRQYLGRVHVYDVDVALDVHKSTRRLESTRWMQTGPLQPEASCALAAGGGG